MPYRNQARWAVFAVVGALAAIATPGAAHADDWVQPFPAGVACTFGITVTGVDNPHRVMKEFADADGNARFLQAGRGSDLTFTNDETGATFSLRGNGAVTTATVYAGGSATVENRGHIVLIFYPT